MAFEAAAAHSSIGRGLGEGEARTTPCRGGVYFALKPGVSPGSAW